MKGQKRLDEIKKRLQATIRSVAPESRGRYVVSYEPFQDTHYMTPDQVAHMEPRFKERPSYQFLITDQTNPKQTGAILRVNYSDIEKSTPKDMVKYMGGYGCADDVRKMLDTLGKSEKGSRGRKSLGGLEKTGGIVSIISLVLGLFFLSPNVTGNAISNLSIQTTSFLGAGLLIVGLVAGFFWLRSRKK